MPAAITSDPVVYCVSIGPESTEAKPYGFAWQASGASAPQMNRSHEGKSIFSQVAGPANTAVNAMDALLNPTAVAFSLLDRVMRFLTHAVSHSTKHGSPVIPNVRLDDSAHALSTRVVGFVTWIVTLLVPPDSHAHEAVAPSVTPNALMRTTVGPLVMVMRPPIDLVDACVSFVKRTTRTVRASTRTIGSSIELARLFATPFTALGKPMAWMTIRIASISRSNAAMPIANTFLVPSVAFAANAFDVVLGVVNPTDLSIDPTERSVAAVVHFVRLIGSTIGRSSWTVDLAAQVAAFGTRVVRLTH